MFGVVLASDTLATTTVTFVGTLFDGFIVFSSTVVNDTCGAIVVVVFPTFGTPVS